MKQVKLLVEGQEEACKRQIFFEKVRNFVYGFMYWDFSGKGSMECDKIWDRLSYMWEHCR